MGTISPSRISWDLSSFPLTLRLFCVLLLFSLMWGCFWKCIHWIMYDFLFFFPSSGSSKHTKSTSRVNFKAWSGTLWHLPVFSISSLIYANVTRLCCLVYNISLQTPLHTLCCQLFPGNMFDFKELLGISMWLRSSTENKMYVKEQNSATYAVWLAGCFWKVQHRDAAELRAMKDGNEAEMNTLSPGSHQSCFIVSGILLI